MGRVGAGPMPVIWTTTGVSPPDPSQCTAPPGWNITLPGPSGTAFDRSNTGPVPVYQVPDRTVTVRSLGWMCGVSITWGGKLARIT